MESIDDLDTVFTDQSLLLVVRAKISHREAKKFEQSYHTYTDLVGETETDASSISGFSLNDTYFKSPGEAERMGREEKLQRRVEGKYV